jgi:hypothetical protein
MAINRNEVLYSLCVEDIITVLEETFNVDFDSLEEKHQEELIRLGKKGFENGLNWHETCSYAVEEYLEDNNLAEFEDFEE